MTKAVSNSSTSPREPVSGNGNPSSLGEFIPRDTSTPASGQAGDLLNAVKASLGPGGTAYGSNSGSGTSDTSNGVPTAPGAGSVPASNLLDPSLFQRPNQPSGAFPGSMGVSGVPPGVSGAPTGSTGLYGASNAYYGSPNSLFGPGGPNGQNSSIFVPPVIPVQETASTFHNDPSGEQFSRALDEIQTQNQGPYKTGNGAVDGSGIENQSQTEFDKTIDVESDHPDPNDTQETVVERYIPRAGPGFPQPLPPKADFSPLP